MKSHLLFSVTLTFATCIGIANGFVPGKVHGSTGRAGITRGVAPGENRRHHTPKTHCVSTTSLAMNNNENNKEQQERVTSNKITTTARPLSSLILLLVGTNSLFDLFSPKEIPGVFFADGNPQIDYIATAFDLFFVTYAIQNIAQQTGLLGKSRRGNEDGNSSSSSPLSVTKSDIAGFECRITMNIGREKGTWMDKDWGASGARLLLPINLKFTNDEIDLGFPGEESLGGRYVYRLEVLNDNNKVSFVGPQGEVQVEVTNGGWATLPSNSGETKLRFFLDFPQGAIRNDVSIPSGRVYFSTACFPTNSGDVQGKLRFDESTVASVNRNDKNVAILKEGGITIKNNTFMNLYGALGDVNLILGRYKVDSFVDVESNDF